MQQQQQKQQSMGSKPRRRGRPSGVDNLDRILRDALANISVDDDLSAPEQEELRTCLAQRDRNTGDGVLHLLARSQQREDNTADADDAKRCRLLERLLRQDPGMLEARNNAKSTPTHVALESCNDRFVSTVLNAAELQNSLPGVLGAVSGSGMNCLHLAVEHSFPDLKLMIDCLSGSSLQAILAAQAPRLEDTPLHMAVQKLAPGDGRIEEHPVDKQDVTEEEEGGCWGEWLKRVLQGDHGEDEPDTTAGTGGTQRQQHQHQQQPSPPESETGVDHHHHQPDGGGDHEDGGEDDADLRVVRLLVEAWPDALGIKNGEGRTAYQEREHVLRQSRGITTAVEQHVRAHRLGHEGRQQIWREIFGADAIASYIRSYCVRSPGPREQIAARLYRPGQEQQVEFDLVGIPESIVSLAYLTRLAEHIRFERILRYVALPNLTVQLSSRDKAPSRRQVGRRDVVAVFDWLWRCGVRRIIQVMVVDDQAYPPHADSAIVEALRRFRVEEWDWKRVDLSSDVIYRSAPLVREASLYCSGSHAVMMGWAGAGGLGNRDKFPRLERVTLFIREGLEDPITQISYSNALVEGIRCHAASQGAANPIDIRVFPDTRSGSSQADCLPESTISGVRHTDDAPNWIKSIRDFSIFLKHALAAQEQPGPADRAPRIAILDDGVDAAVPILRHRIAAGVSFFPHAGSAGLANPFYVPSGRHGTLMAQLISDICPSARLYIARLEELPAEGAGTGGRCITARSAARAVRWAVDCGVDVVSMSWTIQTTAPDSADMNALREAVLDAERARIVMFCSAADQGGHSTQNSYPAGWRTCLQIGAATFTGEKLGAVEDGVDFWFPGERVPIRGGGGGGAGVTYESGSSVATAAASGLAGVLICCARLLGGDHADSFRGSGPVRRAFKRMATGRDGSFPRADEVFRIKFSEKLRWAHDPAGLGRHSSSGSGSSIEGLEWNSTTRQALEDLVNYIKVIHPDHPSSVEFVWPIRGARPLTWPTVR